MLSSTRLLRRRGLRFCRGNILDSDAEVVVVTVNCVGVMGKGLALQAKERWPRLFAEYAADCRDGRYKLGNVHSYRDVGRGEGRHVVCFPTKRHWRERSRIEDVRAGLQDLAHSVRRERWRSLAVPALGCQNGGLDWREVCPVIEEVLSPLARKGVQVDIYEPMEFANRGLQPANSRQTTVVHIRQPHDVCVMRPSKWGNPFIIGKDGDRPSVIRKYEEWILTQPDLLASLHELRGRRLGCGCAPEPCHGDVLARLADAVPANPTEWDDVISALEADGWAAEAGAWGPPAYLRRGQDLLGAYADRPPEEMLQHAVCPPAGVACWSDGSGTSSDKPAGIGVVRWIRAWNEVGCAYTVVSEVSECVGKGTNQVAELLAVWRALTMCPNLRVPLVVRTDSEYAIGCATSPTWNIRANKALVERIRRDVALRGDKVRFEHVRGHSGDPNNERADALARAGRKLGISDGGVK